VDEAEREGTGSLEPLATGGGEMSEKYVLASDCSERELKDKCMKVIQNELGMYALVNRHESRWRIVGVPREEYEDIWWEIGSFEFVTILGFEDGKYFSNEILYDHDKVFSWIKEKKLEITPGLYELNLNSVYEITEEYLEYGYADNADHVPTIIRNSSILLLDYWDEIWWKRMQRYNIEVDVKLADLLSVPPLLPIVFGPPGLVSMRSKNEDGKAEATKTNLIKFLMLSYLDDTNGKGDFLGCIQFLLKNGVEKDDEERHFIWRSTSGELQKNAKKTMQNLFSKRKKEWQQQ
jgi:hypothetical protein